MIESEIQKLKDILWANTWSNEEIIDEGIATLKKSMEYKEEGFRRIESAGLLAIYTLQQENKQLKEQLKQRDEVIDEAIKYIEENTELEHDGDEYGFTEWIDIKEQNIVFINSLLAILKKYKGDNNG